MVKLLVRRDRSQKKYILIYLKTILPQGPTQPFKAVCKLGLEGMVSKKLDVPYKSGPSKVWANIESRL
jgi:ATP-dependent DNA ligase